MTINFVQDHAMIKMRSEKIENVIEINVWMDWIINCVLTKFDQLKMDEDRDAGMSSETTYHHATCR